MDWSLRHCARKGHVTYAPTERELRERLHAATPAGEAWRCLRCGDFVPGEPRGSGPAEDAPPVPRGRVLRDLFILRILAVERAIRGVLILLLVYGVVRVRDRQSDLRTAFNEDLPLLPLIELVEGVGLWYAKRWAEYLTVVATAAFLPLEIRELAEKVTGLRIGALVFNVLAVLYLLWAKRLFGLRGGHRAVEAERHSESLLEVRHAAQIS